MRRHLADIDSRSLGGAIPFTFTGVRAANRDVVFFDYSDQIRSDTALLITAFGIDRAPTPAFHEEPLRAFLALGSNGRHSAIVESRRAMLRLKFGPYVEIAHHGEIVRAELRGPPELIAVTDVRIWGVMVQLLR